MKTSSLFKKTKPEQTLTTFRQPLGSFDKTNEQKSPAPPPHQITQKSLKKGGGGVDGLNSP